MIKNFPELTFSLFVSPAVQVFFFWNNFKQQKPYNNVTDRNESRSTLLGWYICLGILQTNRELDYLEHPYALLAFTHLQTKILSQKSDRNEKILALSMLLYHIDFASFFAPPSDQRRAQSEEVAFFRK